MVFKSTDVYEFFNSIPIYIGEDHEEDEEVKEIKEPKPEQLKSHLNGLYNGLAKIMMSTSQLDGQTPKNSPFVVEKAVHNIMFIKHHMKRQDEFDAVSLDRSLKFIML